MNRGIGGFVVFSLFVFGGCGENSPVGAPLATSQVDEPGTKSVAFAVSGMS